MKYVATVFFLSFFTLSHAQNAPDSIPAWFAEHMQQMVGTWETDNANYLNEHETWDAYGIIWEYGIGEMSINGRLYGIKDGERSGDFWEFKTFWNPEDGKVYAYRFGGNGTVGKGEMAEEKMLQIFYNPDGTAYKVGHKAWFDDQGNHHTQSYNVSDVGDWEKRRYYVWKKK